MAQRKNKIQKQPVASKKLAEKSTAQKKRKYFFWLFMIVLISFIAFLPVLHNGFVNLDDDRYIQNNPLLSSINLKQIFSSYMDGNYHPLTVLTYSIEYHLFGLNEHGYHAVNLMLHLINVVLVFYVVLFLCDKIEVALIASLLFGVHPIHVESVAWASELKDLLYTFFFLSSYICYLRYLKETKKKFYFYCLLLFLFSLFSKAMAVSLPVVLLLTDYFIRKDSDGKEIKMNVKSWLEKIPFFALSILFGVIAIVAQKSSNAIVDLDYFPFYQRMVFACYGFITYLFKLLFPFHLSVFYPYPVRSGDGISGWYYIYPFIILALIVYVFYSLRFSRKIFFGIGFFAITVFLVLQLLPVGNTIMADRYCYIPSIGIFYQAGEGIFWLWMKKTSTSNQLKLPVTILIGSVVIFFSLTTYQRCIVWQNSMSLWNDVISKYQTIPIAYNNRGMIFEANNKTQEALDDYNKAIALQPNFAIARNNRGNILMNLQKYEEALRDYDKAIEVQPNLSEPYNGRGVILMREEKYELAINNYHKAIELKPNFAEAYYNIAVSEYNLGKKDDACRDLQKAINLGLQQATDLFNKLCH